METVISPGYIERGQDGTDRFVKNAVEAPNIMNCGDLAETQVLDADDALWVVGSDGIQRRVTARRVAEKVWALNDLGALRDQVQEAQGVKAAAEAAQTGALAAKSAAEQAYLNAQNAKNAAETAQQQTLQIKQAAEAANHDTQAAKDDAIEAADAAQAARTAAELAKNAAQQASVRPPVSHASSHGRQGSDPITPASIGTISCQVRQVTLPPNLNPPLEEDPETGDIIIPDGITGGGFLSSDYMGSNVEGGSYIARDTFTQPSGYQYIVIIKNMSAHIAAGCTFRSVTCRETGQPQTKGIFLSIDGNNSERIEATVFRVPAPAGVSNLIIAAQ